MVMALAMSLAACCTRSTRTTVHSLQVRRHTSAALTEARAGQILADATAVLRTNDGPGDVPADVRLERNGTVTAFAAGTGIINSRADFEAVNNLPGNVKVVTQINWCGNFAPNIIGCAPVPGTSRRV